MAVAVAVADFKNADGLAEEIQAAGAAATAGVDSTNAGAWRLLA